MNYGFWANNKVIPLNEIKCLYYAQQNLSESNLVRWAQFFPPINVYFSYVNTQNLYTIVVDNGKKKIGFAVARPGDFLDLIQVLLPYRIEIKKKCISEMSPKAHKMVLAGSAVSITA